MLTRTITLTAVSVFAAACSGSPAGPTGPTTRDLAPSFNAGGVPNPASCHGQVVSEVARASEGGFAGFANSKGVPVQEAQRRLEKLAGVACLTP
jgi:hypothetical protein